MKTVKKLLALTLCLCMILTLLAACGAKKLSGEYSAEIAGSGVSYTFNGSKVSITLKAFDNIVYTVEGSYKIEEDQITFTFPSGEENTEDYSGTKSFAEGEDYIKIGKVTYTKR